MRSIVIENICPPIPTRNFDWVAYREGADMDGPYAHGATPEEALKELMWIESMEEME